MFHSFRVFVTRCQLRPAQIALALFAGLVVLSFVAVTGSPFQPMEASAQAGEQGTSVEVLFAGEFQPPLALAGAPGAVQRQRANKKRPKSADELMFVDCLLPGQLRKLGRRNTYMTARRPVRTTGRDCEIRGGEYTAFDRANYQSALKVWLRAAQEGDANAMTIVGEIYEQGLGTDPDYGSAVTWYERAVKKGDKRAAQNLAYLVEMGLGTERDPARAAELLDMALGGGDDTASAAPSGASDPSEQMKQFRKELETQELQAQRVAVLADIERRKASGSATADLESQAAQLKSRIDSLLRELEGERKQADEKKAQEAQQLVRSRKAAPGASSSDVDFVIAPPEITVIDPQQALTRGATEVSFRTRGEVRTIVGVIEAVAGVKSFLVNGEDQTDRLTSTNLFSTKVSMGSERTTVTLSAIDGLNQRTDLEISFVLGDAASSKSRSTPRLGKGKYYALVIGNNEYDEWIDLETAKNDARAVADLLRTKYGFDEVVLLEDANRLEMLSALDDMHERVKPNDNFLLYYAGHGQYDRDINQIEPEMYWVPVDGDKTRTANWIATSEIARHLNRLEARGVLVITDSCWSAWLIETAPIDGSMSEAERARLTAEQSRLVARLAISSGGLQEVLDYGDGTHSLFAVQLLELLRSNQDTLTSSQIHKWIRARVELAAAELDFAQTPDFGGIRRSRHEGGEFFLNVR